MCRPISSRCGGDSLSSSRRQGRPSTSGAPRRALWRRLGSHDPSCGFNWVMLSDRPTRPAWSEVGRMWRLLGCLASRPAVLEYALLRADFLVRTNQVGRLDRLCEGSDCCLTSVSRARR
eukprot:scaffold15277_cov34-Tisochrysis_lutea.AAC.3